MSFIWILPISFISILVMILPLRNHSQKKFLVMISMMILFLGSLGLYLILGQPDTPDLPFEKQKIIRQNNLIDMVILESSLPKDAVVLPALQEAIRQNSELLQVDPNSLRTKLKELKQQP